MDEQSDRDNSIDCIRSAGDRISTIVATATDLLQNARRLVFAARSDLKLSSARLDSTPPSLLLSLVDLSLSPLPPWSSSTSIDLFPSSSYIYDLNAGFCGEKRWFHLAEMVTRCARRICTRDSFVPVAVHLITMTPAGYSTIVICANADVEDQSLEENFVVMQGNNFLQLNFLSFFYISIFCIF